MSETSIWAPIRALASRVMFCDSRIVMAKDTLERLSQELVEYERKTDNYVGCRNVLYKQLKQEDLKTSHEMDDLRKVILSLDKSREKLHNKIEELDKEICVLINQQVSLRKELKEQLARLCSFKYIIVTGVEDLHALMCLKDIENQHALAFTLGNSTKGKALLNQIGVNKMGTEIKVGTLYKVQNGEFSVVPEKHHGCFEFDRRN